MKSARAWQTTVSGVMMMMAVLASLALAADKEPARFPVVFELRNTDGFPASETNHFSLRTEETLDKPDGNWEEWMDNSYYMSHWRTGEPEVRFEKVRPGRYRLFLGQLQGLFPLRVAVGTYELKEAATIPLNPRLHSCKVSLPFPLDGKPDRDRPEVYVESHGGAAFGYSNRIFLSVERDRLEGVWDFLPEDGKFQFEYYVHGDRTKRRMADVTVTPEMVKSGLIRLRFLPPDDISEAATLVSWQLEKTLRERIRQRVVAEASKDSRPPGAAVDDVDLPLIFGQACTDAWRKYKTILTVPGAEAKTILKNWPNDVANRAALKRNWIELGKRGFPRPEFLEFLYERSQAGELIGFWDLELARRISDFHLHEGKEAEKKKGGAKRALK